ncbi:hypothetical protein BLJ79_18505 [Arthrobacter sp. UCD-GKA]|uniref:hypothetical protein n=1 Tax=Arthrobacter sp. UCD-GKA TaxID=1913576 RepID=UPI0008DDAA79|nr:hypothetical protein [Arthrobacter sp. UCD-GKA]OIH82713.1 hypothetical protein BLJ79_18505 [Arthrobacter sp. UCD-GKA]
MFPVPRFAAIACGHLSWRRAPHARPLAVFGPVVGYVMPGMRMIATFFGHVINGRVRGSMVAPAGPDPGGLRAGLEQGLGVVRDRR